MVEGGDDEMCVAALVVDGDIDAILGSIVDEGVDDSCGGISRHLVFGVEGVLCAKAQAEGPLIIPCDGP